MKELDFKIVIKQEGILLVKLFYLYDRIKLRFKCRWQS